MENLTLRWRANNNTFYRIDFDTTVITPNSRFMFFQGFASNDIAGTAGAAADIPNDHWYDFLGTPPGGYIVRNDTETLRDFINNHPGASNEYTNARDTVNNSLTTVSRVGAAVDAGKYKSRRRKSKSRSRRRKSKSRSRRRKSKSKSRIHKSRSKFRRRKSRNKLQKRRKT